MKPRHLGLTGNIGSGKSTVAQLFVKKGAALIDSDALAHEATEDPEVLRQIAEALGAGLVKEGRLDRAATARLVFHDSEARKRLNGIVHPWVRRRSAERIAELEHRPSPPPMILLDIPLLYENDLDRDLDGVIVVWASLETRVRRARARSGLSEEEVKTRDAAQLPLEEKVKRADYVIDNEGDLEGLERQVEALWKVFISS